MRDVRTQAGAIAIATVLLLGGGALVGVGATVGAYEAGVFGSGGPSSDTPSTTGDPTSPTAAFPRIVSLKFFGGSDYEYDTAGPPVTCAAAGEPAGQDLGIAVFAPAGVDGAPRVTLRAGPTTLGTLTATPFSGPSGPHITLWSVSVEFPAGTIATGTTAPLEAAVTARDKAGRTADDTVTGTLRSCTLPPSVATPPPPSPSIPSPPVTSPPPTSPPDAPSPPPATTTTTIACNPNDPSSPGFPCQH